MISGASRGLGRALAQEFAQRGDHVHAGYYSNKPQFDHSSNGTISPVSLNVRDLESTANACGNSAAEGALDILINNAGIHMDGRLEDLEQDDFKHILDVNLLGVWRLTKAALPYMPDGGTIVMISSLSGLVGLPRDGAYAASKFALEGMSQSLAAELAPRAIRVLVIEPGAIATGFAGNETGDDPDTVARQIADIVEQPGPEMRYPLGNTGQFVSDQLDLDRGVRAESIVRKITGNGWLKS
ncbi:MAG: SDR family NAD(P)-dependent oxidoreductase [Parasphingorhabdus sp.]